VPEIERALFVDFLATTCSRGLPKGASELTVRDRMRSFSEEDISPISTANHSNTVWKPLRPFQMQVQKILSRKIGVFSSDGPRGRECDHRWPNLIDHKQRVVRSIQSQTLGELQGRSSMTTRRHGRPSRSNCSAEYRVDW
jgi:hypothetical protein